MKSTIIANELAAIKKSYKNSLRKNWQNPKYSWRSIVNEEIDKLFAKGCIESSNRPCSLPMTLVNKHNDTRRLCVHYRLLNKRSTPDAYPCRRSGIPCSVCVTSNISVVLISKTVIDSPLWRRIVKRLCNRRPWIVPMDSNVVRQRTPMLKEKTKAPSVLQTKNESVERPTSSKLVLPVHRATPLVTTSLQKKKQRTSPITSPNPNSFLFIPGKEFLEEWRVRTDGQQIATKSNQKAQLMMSFNCSWIQTRTA